MLLSRYIKAVGHIRILLNAPVDKIITAFPYTIGISALLSLAIVILQRFVQSPSPRSLAVSIASGLALCIATVLALLMRGTKPSLPLLAEANDQQELLVRVFLISSQIGILILPFSAYFAVWQSHASQLDWYVYGFFDKRFLLSLYWTFILTFLIMPPVLWKLLSKDNDHNGLAASPVTDDLSSQASKSKARNMFANTYVKLFLALLVTCFMYGPPWNISATPLSINSHEQVFLGPLQAMDKGYLPDIGPASQQYGPGFQVIIYSIMKISGQFNLFGFRQAEAVIDFVGFGIFAVIAFYLLTIPFALVATGLFSLTVSPFAMMQWTSTGSLFIWGWPNPLRYIGSLVLLVLLSRSFRLQKKTFWQPIIIGIIWGLFIWIAPENIVTGMASSTLFCVLLWVTHTTTLGKILRTIGLTIIGVILFWAPVVIFYLTHGLLAQYLFNVFHVGSEVINGFSNTLPGTDILQSPYLSNIVYFSVPLLVICGLIVLFNKMTLVHPLKREHLYIIALICVSLSNLFGALTRSDASHLTNTLISLPIIIAFLMQELPRLISPFAIQTAFARVVVILFALMFALNQGSASYTDLSIQYGARLARYINFNNQPKGNTMSNTSLAFTRTGYAVIPDEDLTTIPDIPILKGIPTALSPTELQDFDDLHSILGNNAVYVQSFPGNLPGLPYFFADLTPPPLSVDPSTMVFSSEDKANFLDHFKTIANRTNYLITDDPQAPEVGLFLTAHPGATSIKRTFWNSEYFIFGTFQSNAVRQIDVRYQLK